MNKTFKIHDQHSNSPTCSSYIFCNSPTEDFVFHLDFASEKTRAFTGKTDLPKFVTKRLEISLKRVILAANLFCFATTASGHLKEPGIRLFF